MRRLYRPCVVLGRSNDVIYFCLGCYILSVWDFAVESTGPENNGALSGLEVSSHHVDGSGTLVYLRMIDNY